VCVCTLSSYAQVHNQDINTSTFFSGNFTDTRHFEGATFGLSGGNLFIGGINGDKGIAWNAMENTAGTYNFLTTRSAAKIDYSHWNQLWALKFSDNPGSSGNPVNWQQGLQAQRVSSGDVEMRLCGDFFAREININASIGWCDYVLAPDYKLRSLSEIEAFIKENQHLPEVPSEKEVYENGIAVTEMLQIQMKKIEELTLYTIQQQKEIDALKALLTNK
jgi:hypothetical protein